MGRLLTLLLLYQAGYEVGRFISLERIIEDSKGFSYSTLKRVLFDLKREKKVRCLGKGRDAEWERIGS